MICEGRKSSSQLRELHNEYLERHRVAAERITVLEGAKKAWKNRARILETFIRNISASPQAFTEFDERLRGMTADWVTVMPDDRIVLRFRNGMEVER